MATPYDFRRPTKLSRDHVRVLEIAYETFSRQWSTLLTSSLRVVTDVTLVSVEQRTYDEYVAELGSSTVMGLFAPQPLAGTGVMQIPMETAMTCIDHLLGGPGTGEQPKRPLTDIEAVLVRGLLERALGELRYAFAAILPLRPQLGALEVNPQFAQAAAATDVMVVATFDMQVGSSTGAATLALPFASLAPRLPVPGTAAVSAEQAAVRAAARTAMASGMQSVPLDVAVRFAALPMSPDRVLALAVGDVVMLEHTSDTPLDVVAADVTFARAVAGARGTRLACLVVDPSKEQA